MEDVIKEMFLNYPIRNSLIHRDKYYFENFPVVPSFKTSDL